MKKVVDHQIQVPVSDWRSSIPLPASRQTPHSCRQQLSAGQLIAAVILGAAILGAGRAPDTASAVEIAIGQEHRGGGLSHPMLAALRDAAKDAALSRA